MVISVIFDFFATFQLFCEGFLMRRKMKIEIKIFTRAIDRTFDGVNLSQIDAYALTQLGKLTAILKITRIKR